ncbi:hypothetical protein I6F53_09785 [Pseudoalteromonas sp. SWN29]|uniref:hypothetical protein n=1 Tax=Pseudoalteromonas sp. SWN29 TaxID=2792064 RepID=UPI0018CEE323|nr:hypothetical protein [Pseudoalteromonas sp. SWN29]MBH0027278.1 hypothetical protein [Pseudoalteromonas sp. SWN29]
MPDVTDLFYIAIMAFYLLRSNDGSKLIITTIVLAAIPLFTSDYWQWLQLSGLLSVIILIIEKEKAGATAGGAIAVLVALFIGAFIVSIIINAAWTFTSNFKLSTFEVKAPLSYGWSTHIIWLYCLTFVIPLFAILRGIKKPVAFFGTNLTALALAVLPHYCGSFIYGLMLSVAIIASLYLVAFVFKTDSEQRFMFTYMGMSGLLTSCIVKGVMVAYF